ncbi:hypothetical protein HK102_013600 [Quaeritorhiza haematococci]|nr:hypothetical protein HK102_013600 [Quaeritorhiza haematococci]
MARNAPIGGYTFGGFVLSGGVDPATTVSAPSPKGSASEKSHINGNNLAGGVFPGKPVWQWTSRDRIVVLFNFSGPVSVSRDDRMELSVGSGYDLRPRSFEATLLRRPRAQQSVTGAGSVGGSRRSNKAGNPNSAGTRGGSSAPPQLGLLARWRWWFQTRVLPSLGFSIPQQYDDVTADPTSPLVSILPGGVRVVNIADDACGVPAGGQDVVVAAVEKMEMARDADEEQWVELLKGNASLYERRVAALFYSYHNSIYGSPTAGGSGGVDARGVAMGSGEGAGVLPEPGPVMTKMEMVLAVVNRVSRMLLGGEPYRRRLWGYVKGRWQKYVREEDPTATGTTTATNNAQLGHDDEDEYEYDDDEETESLAKQKENDEYALDDEDYYHKSRSGSGGVQWNETVYAGTGKRKVSASSATAGANNATQGTTYQLYRVHFKLPPSVVMMSALSAGEQGQAEDDVYEGEPLIGDGDILVVNIRPDAVYDAVPPKLPLQCRPQIIDLGKAPIPRKARRRKQSSNNTSTDSTIISIFYGMFSIFLAMFGILPASIISIFTASLAVWFTLHLLGMFARAFSPNPPCAMDSPGKGLMNTWWLRTRKSMRKDEFSRIVAERTAARRAAAVAARKAMIEQQEKENAIAAAEGAQSEGSAAGGNGQVVQEMSIRQQQPDPTNTAERIGFMIGNAIAKAIAFVIVPGGSGGPRRGSPVKGGSSSQPQKSAEENGDVDEPQQEGAVDGEQSKDQNGSEPPPPKEDPIMLESNRFCVNLGGNMVDIEDAYFTLSANPSPSDGKPQSAETTETTDFMPKKPSNAESSGNQKTPPGNEPGCLESTFLTEWIIPNVTMNMGPWLSPFVGRGLGLLLAVAWWALWVAIWDVERVVREFFVEALAEETGLVV